MSKTEILEELPRLTAQEREEIRAKLAELEGTDEDGWCDDGELTEEEKAALNAAIVDYKKSPEGGSLWEEVETAARARLQE